MYEWPRRSGLFLHKFLDRIATSLSLTHATFKETSSTRPVPVKTPCEFWRIFCTTASLGKLLEAWDTRRQIAVTFGYRRPQAADSLSTKIDEVVMGMMEAGDFYANEIVQVKTPSRCKRRFVLVGDAGYALGFTGAVTTFAIAGPYVLAGEVGRHKGNLVTGLRDYDHR